MTSINQWPQGWQGTATPSRTAYEHDGVPYQFGYSSIGNMIADLESAVMAMASTSESLTAQIELVDRARVLAQRWESV